MAIMTVDQRYGKDAVFFHAHRGPHNTIYPITPWVLTHHLVTLGLSTAEQLVCRALLDFRYSLAMAKMDLGELAHEIGRSIRQVQRIVKRLREKQLIEVTPRVGRPSIIDVSPLVLAVKKLLNWQEAEQPTAETLAEVVAEPEPTEEELFWLHAAESSEEEPEYEEEDIWNDIKAELRKLVPYEAYRNHLDDTTGLRFEDEILIVSAKPGSLGRLQEFKAAADIIIQERYLNALGVKFEPVKKPKKLGPLARLAVAAVGV